MVTTFMRLFDLLADKEVEIRLSIIYILEGKSTGRGCVFQFYLQADIYLVEDLHLTGLFVTNLNVFLISRRNEIAKLGKQLLAFFRCRI
jgi:hypothetical protein